MFLEGFWDVTCGLELAGEFGNESIIRLTCVEILKLPRAGSPSSLYTPSFVSTTAN